MSKQCWCSVEYGVRVQVKIVDLFDLSVASRRVDRTGQLGSSVFRAVMTYSWLCCVGVHNKKRLEERYMGSFNFETSKLYHFLPLV